MGSLKSAKSASRLRFPLPYLTSIGQTRAQSARRRERWTPGIGMLHRDQRERNIGTS
jgi:hypothetical protein